jgi:Zn ribbon nucleic-acid-binding protein
LEAQRDYTDTEKFSVLVERLSKHGFRVVGRPEMSGYQKATKLIPPNGRKPRPGQLALVYTHMNGTRVLCWTTFNEAFGKFIDKGLAAAWVLILNQQGEARHISRMIKRVDKFVDRIFKECLINKNRVAGSAYCPSCSAPTKLAWRREYVRGRYWICSRAGVHMSNGDKPPTFPFNHGLSGKLLEYVEARNVRRDKYASKRRKEGKDPYHQMKTRKRWLRGNRPNPQSDPK